MKNQFQFRAWVFDMVRAGESEDKIFLAVRSGDPDLYKVVTTVQTRDSRGQIVDSVSPKLLQDMIKKCQEEWNQPKPLNKAYQVLHYSELALRGDLQEALTELDLTDPGDIRDAVKQAVAIASREEWGAAGLPKDLDDAIGFLKEAGVDVSSYTARLEQLYPTPKPDSE